MLIDAWRAGAVRRVVNNEDPRKFHPAVSCETAFSYLLGTPPKTYTLRQRSRVVDRNDGTTGSRLVGVSAESRAQPAHTERSTNGSLSLWVCKVQVVAGWTRVAGFRVGRFAGAMVADALIDALVGVVGPGNVLVDVDVRAGYETDWTGRFGGAACCVVRPASTDEVSGVLRACSAVAAAVVPQGGNTGLVGGGVPAAARWC